MSKKSEGKKRQRPARETGTRTEERGSGSNDPPTPTIDRRVSNRLRYLSNVTEYDDTPPGYNRLAAHRGGKGHQPNPHIPRRPASVKKLYNPPPSYTPWIVEENVQDSPGGYVPTSPGEYVPSSPTPQTPQTPRTPQATRKSPRKSPKK